MKRMYVDTISKHTAKKRKKESSMNRFERTMKHKKGFSDAFLQQSVYTLQGTADEHVPFSNVLRIVLIALQIAVYRVVSSMNSAKVCNCL